MYAGISSHYLHAQKGQNSNITQSDSQVNRHNHLHFKGLYEQPWAGQRLRSEIGEHRPRACTYGDATSKQFRDHRRSKTRAPASLRRGGRRRCLSATGSRATSRQNWACRRLSSQPPPIRSSSPRPNQACEPATTPAANRGYPPSTLPTSAGRGRRREHTRRCLENRR